MPAITYELGAKNQKLKQTLKDSKGELANYRKNVRDQFRDMAREARIPAAPGGGIFGGVLKGNLAAQAVQRGAAALRDGVNAVGELVDASDQLGISAENLGKLQRVMEGAGVETENLRKSLLTLNTARQAAINGDEKAAEKFTALGIAAHELQNSTLEETFFAVADGLKGIGDSGERAQRAMDLVGSKNAKLVGEMSKGGSELRKQMSDVSGAVAEANARAVDGAADTAASAWSAAKGFLTNLAGEGIQSAGRTFSAIKEGFSESADAAQDYSAHVAAYLADAEKKQAEAAQKSADAKRLAASAAAAAAKADAENSERATRAAAEEADAEKDRATTLRETLTMRERLASALAEAVSARKEYDRLAPGIEKEEAGARLARARANLEDERAKHVERASLPAVEREALARADRKAAKDARKGERVFQGKERDRIDRAFRDGRIDPKERDRLMEELRLGKKPGEQGGSLPEQTLREMKNISDLLAKFNEKITSA